MKFREWINIDEVRFKGLNRAFRQTHPDIPRYVGRQAYNTVSHDFNRIVNQHNKNRIQPNIDWQLYIRQKISHGEQLTPEEDALWRQIQSAKARPMAVEAAEPEQSESPKPTIDYLSPTIAYNPKQNLSLKDILDNEVTKYQWSNKPSVIKVCPLDFDQGTLNKFFSEMFGFKPSQQVRNNAERYAIQQKLAQTRDTNEPILIANEAGKYKLVEGFHRAMVALLSAHDDNAGAPRDHVEALKAGHPPHSLDLTQWRRVPLLAYIGQRLA